ncbi:MAG: efflux RND transporter periplasmic adaptor subunit [Kiritimatiellae bacterium]|jgi:RND family efflux transporter MFP subunit|nr:efflux RND transporter periplasmic adaptor subunit [Kiritimatiellia bacterium]
MSDKKYSKHFIIVARIVIIAIIIGGALLISKILIDTKPKNPQRPRKERTTIATTIPLDKSEKQIFLMTTGIITPDQKLSIYPQVTGKITKMAESFEPGYFIKKGDNIALIDSADYDIALIEAEAKVTEAQYAYDLESGYQSVAKHEWDLFENKDQLNDLEKKLMRRVPHLKKAEAQLMSAKAELDKAKLNVSRTKISAPFNAVVLSRDVSLGSLVSSQTSIGTIVNSDSFRAEATLPVEQLEWIKTISNSKTQSTAWISLSGNSSDQNVWEGKVQEIMSQIESGGRKAKILIEVPNPFSQKTPLLLNSFVNIKIQGPLLKDVFVVPVEAIHRGNEIWLKNKDNRLDVQKVSIIWRDSETAVISNGFEVGSKLVISSISSPVPGMILATKEEQMKNPAKPEMQPNK